MDILVQKFRAVTQSRECAWLSMHRSDCIYSRGDEWLPVTCLFLVFFKASAVSCFPGNFKASMPQPVPGKNQQQVNMTDGSLTHTLSTSPLENTSLTSPLARKTYLSCGTRCLLLDGCFQVLSFKPSPSTFKRSTKDYIYKAVFLRSPDELAVHFFDVHKAMTWKQLFTLKTEHQWTSKRLCRKCQLSPSSEQ